MASSNGSDALSKAMVDQGIHKAYEREGYLKEDGTLDQQKVREHLYATVAKAKVLSKKDRTEQAITRGALIAEAFPNLPGPDAWNEEDNPTLAMEVYNKIAREYVWAPTKPAADGLVQRMVGMNMGNGYVLCRTKVGKNQVPAVYVTDDLGCIQQDYASPDNKALAAKVTSVTKNREMLLIRQPQNGKKFLREYDATLKAAIEAAHNQLELTLESVTNLNGDDEDEEDGQ